MTTPSINLAGRPEYLRVGGTPYEAGIAQGQVYGPLIRYTWRKIRTQFFNRNGEEVSSRLDFLIRETEKRFPEEIAEVRGIADGAGLEFLQAFLIYRHLGRAMGCTAVGVTHSDDGPVAGANLDDDALYFMKDSNIDGQYRYMVTTWPGTLGGGNGFNEHGLAFGGSSARMKFREPDPAPDYLTDNFHIASRVLRCCRTVEEAVEFMKRPDIGGHGNHVIVDADGNAVCVEKYAQTFIAVREPDAKGFIYSVNHFTSEFNTPERQAQHEPRDIDRMNAIGRHLEGLNSHNGRAIITNILRDTVTEKSDWPVSNHRTILSTIMLPRDRAILVSDGPPHLGEYGRYELK